MFRSAGWAHPMRSPRRSCFLPQTTQASSQEQSCLSTAASRKCRGSQLENSDPPGMRTRLPVGRERSSQFQVRQYQPNRRNRNYWIVGPSNHSAVLVWSRIELRTKHESLLEVLEEKAHFGEHPTH